MALVPQLLSDSLRHYNGVYAADQALAQSTNEVLMVAPTAFGFNAAAAEDNAFMHSDAGGADARQGSTLTRQVLREYAGLYHQLTEVAGVKVSNGHSAIIVTLCGLRSMSHV